MSKPGVMFYFDVRPCIKRLNLNEKGQLFEAILDYAESGIEPELDGALGIAWDFIQPRIDLDSEQYELKVEGSQYAAFSRERKKLGLEPISRDEWRSMTDIERCSATSSDENDAPETSGDIKRYPNSNSKSKSKSKSNPNNLKREAADKPPRASRFTPPTVDEVKTYCVDRGSSVDPEKFVDFYSANGWKQGKNKPIVDWKAAVRTWERSDAQQKAQDKNRVRTSAEYREEADFFG